MQVPTETTKVGEDGEEVPVTDPSVHKPLVFLRIRGPPGLFEATCSMVIKEPGPEAGFEVQSQNTRDRASLTLQT